LKNCRFLVRDACDTQFADASFDTIIAAGIIHHLPIAKSLQEISRLLRPQGKAIFLEPLGANPFIKLYRKLTPNARTPDETPLTRSDVATIQNIFHPVSIGFYGLTTLLSIPLRHNQRIFSMWYNILYFIDKVLFITPARWWAWTIVVEGSKRH